MNSMIAFMTLVWIDLWIMEDTELDFSPNKLIFYYFQFLQNHYKVK